MLVLRMLVLLLLMLLLMPVRFRLLHLVEVPSVFLTPLLVDPGKAAKSAHGERPSRAYAGLSRGGHLVGAYASGERIAPRARSGADRAFASQGGAVKRHGPPLHTGVVPTTTATGQATLPFPSVTTTTPAPVTAPDATSEQTSESAPATTENSSSGSPSVPTSLITATTTKSASVTTTAFASATSEYAFVTTAQ